MSERLKTILVLASLGLFVLAADACVRSVLPPTLRFHSHKGKLLLVCMSVDEATRVEQNQHRQRRRQRDARKEKTDPALCYDCR